ncbi:MAG: hypothetical protein JJ975_05860 [Bacteroidia bacterium]|nr:hypothetical protein [Bacteroidia bacterium]
MEPQKPKNNALMIVVACVIVGLIVPASGILRKMNVTGWPLYGLYGALVGVGVMILMAVTNGISGLADFLSNLVKQVVSKGLGIIGIGLLLIILYILLAPGQ